MVAVDALDEGSRASRRRTGFVRLHELASARAADAHGSQGHELCDIALIVYVRFV